MIVPRAGDGKRWGARVNGAVLCGVGWCHPERSEGGHAGMGPFAALRVTQTSARMTLPGACHNSIPSSAPPAGTTRSSRS